MLPPRKPKKPKRESRWKSQKHLDFVRSHACSMCGSMAGIQSAHVRIGSGAGMGQKPDDFRAVSLCHNCHHFDQHQHGEETFWNIYRDKTGQSVGALILAFIKASPLRSEIERVMQERSQ